MRLTYSDGIRQRTAPSAPPGSATPATGFQAFVFRGDDPTSRLRRGKQARVIGGCKTGFKTSNRHVAIRDSRIAIRQKIRMSAR